MEHNYNSIFSLVEDFVKALKKMQEEDKQTWPPDRAIPCGFEDAIDSLKEHAEDVRDFDPCPDSDGEGGLIATARPAEWIREDHEVKRAETKQLMKDIEYASKYH